MPTTPNPTPPISDPATGAPSAPVYNTTKPDMLGMSVTATKSQIGYTDHNYDTNTYRSPYYDVPVIVSVPGTVFLDGVCPGRWSRRYYTASDAASLSGGSGYFGYDTNDQDYWWSTNFIDDGDAACSMDKAGGQYYSKNTTIASTHVLMGAVTVGGTNVNLKWGSTWGLVTRNAVFDYLDSTTTYVSRSTTIPRNADGTVDVTALNLSVMKYAPIRGCLVMFDMSSNIVLYTMMDGEQKQFAGSKIGSVAPALALRTATDPSSLPLSSSLTGLPSFSNGAITASSLNSSVTVNMDYSLVNMDRAHKWVSLGINVDAPSTYAYTTTDLAAAQANTSVGFAVGGGGYGKAPVTAKGVFTLPPSGASYVSGWARTGSSSQCIGLVEPGNLFIAVTPYGFTSVAPICQRQGSPVSVLTTANTRQELLSLCPTTVPIAFIYDASVGAYGQVTWISQL